VEIFDSRTKQWSFTKLLHPRMWLTAAGIMDTVMFAGGITHRERGTDRLSRAPPPRRSIVALSGQHVARQPFACPPRKDATKR
jgi:hypothetical protein